MLRVHHGERDPNIFGQLPEEPTVDSVLGLFGMVPISPFPHCAKHKGAVGLSRRLRRAPNVCCIPRKSLVNYAFRNGFPFVFQEYSHCIRFLETNLMVMQLKPQIIPSLWRPVCDRDHSAVEQCQYTKNITS
jgi:hypothetical protein